MKKRFAPLYGLIGLVILFMALSFFISRLTVTEISYSDFLRQAKSGRISDISISESWLQGTEIDQTKPGETYRVMARRVDPQIASQLEALGLPFSGTTEETPLRTVFLWIAPAVIFIALWGGFMRVAGGKQGFTSGFGIGKNKARLYVEKETKVTFADVAGVDEAKEELQEVVKFLKEPQRYSRLGAHIPKGILLVGPPGTGKTLLARAVAGEAGVPFFSIGGSEFVELFVGVGAARVRDLFQEARKQAPAIIFIDELDALGRARGAFPIAGGHDEKDQTLNQLLAELDGFDPSSGVVLLAATNRPEILDPALLRAGRFDRQVVVDRPDKVGRLQILAVHLRKIKLAEDVSSETIAALTPGFTGADIANLANEAAILATRRGADFVSMEDFNNAIERIVAGLEKRNRLLNKHEREVVAYHEAGHAVVGLSLPGTDKIHKISIIPRGIGSLGYTIQQPQEEHFLANKRDLQNKLAVLLGGRAAEIMTFGELSTGAADDLKKATDLARAMVTRYGMADHLGMVSYEAQQPLFANLTDGSNRSVENYSEETSRKIDEAIKALMDGALVQATDVLTEKAPLLRSLAQQLLEKETLSSTEIEALLKGEVAAAA